MSGGPAPLPAWDQLTRQYPRRHRADAPLPGADRLRAAAAQRGQRRHGTALLRRLPRRDRAGGHRPGPGHPPAHRGVQAVAGGPARPEQARRDHRDDRAPARHAADVLRPDRRMGLGRSPATGADVPRRPAPPGPPAAQSPRRRHRRQAAARRPGRPADARARHRGDAAAHRAAGQRVHRPARRRRGPDRRRAVAARPGRQAPRGPLPAAAPAARHPDRRVPGRACPARSSAAAAAGERPRRSTGTPSPG